MQAVANVRRSRSRTAGSRGSSAASKHGDLDPVAKRRLLRYAKGGDRSAREQIVRDYNELVHGVAARYRDLGLPFDDLVQEASIGLLEAMDSFDETRGASFETFARWHVRRAITDALTNQGRLVRLPKQVVERRRAITRTASRLIAKEGHEPTAADITAETGIPAHNVEEIEALPTAVVSLDEPIADEGATLVSLIEDPAAVDPEAAALALQRAQVLTDAVEGLPPRQKHVIRRRYGFGHPAASLADLSSELHICPQRTRAIEQAALFRLAKTLERNPTFQAQAWRPPAAGPGGGAPAVSRRPDFRTLPPRRPAGRSSSSGATRYASPPRVRPNHASRADGRR